MIVDRRQLTHTENQCLETPALIPVQKLKLIALNSQQVCKDSSTYLSLCELYESHSQQCFFQHPDWLLEAQKQLIHQPIVHILAYHQNQLCAWIPLQLREGLTGKLLGLWCSPQHAHLTLNACSIVNNVSLQQLTQRIMDEKKTLLGHCHLISLTQQWKTAFPIDQTRHNRLQASNSSAFFDVSTLTTKPLSGKINRNIRRLQRQAEDQYQIRFETTIENGATMVFQQWLELEAKGWKAASGGAIKQDPRLTAFYQNIAYKFGVRNQCRIKQLWFDDQLVAAQFCLYSQGQWHLLKITFDEHYKTLAPGLILLKWVIEWAQNDPNTQSISLVTSPDWARRWHPSQIETLNFHHFSKQFIGKALDYLWSRKRQPPEQVTSSQ